MLFPLPRRPLTSSGLPGKLEILPFKPAQMSPPGGVSGLLQAELQDRTPSPICRGTCLCDSPFHKALGKCLLGAICWLVCSWISKLLLWEPLAGCHAALTACERSCTAGVLGLDVGGRGPGMTGLPPLSQRPRVPWEGGGYNDGGHDLSSQDTCVPIPAPPLTGRVTLHKSLKFPVPQFPHAK